MNKAILLLISVFFLMGGIDYLMGNRFKLGRKFVEGIKTMGVLGFGMIGIYSLAPVISKVLARILIPFANFLGLDPSIFAGSILAVDMGGFQICKALAATHKMGLFSGVILGSSLGTVISFTIPVALGMIEKKDMEYFSKGMMTGIIIIPVQCLIGGIIERVNVILLTANIFPIVILSAVLCAGLIKVPDLMIKIFSVLGKFIMIISTAGLLLQGYATITGVKIVSGLAPFPETMTVVGRIGFVLAGAYPMLEVIKMLFKKSFEKAGHLIGINTVTVCALIGNLATNIVLFGELKNMNEKGKVIACACAVSCAFVFGGQMGFVSSVAPNLITAYVVSKLAGGLLTIPLASWIYDSTLKEHRIRGNVQTNSL